jgi:hypothetical protein
VPLPGTMYVKIRANERFLPYRHHGAWIANEHKVHPCRRYVHVGANLVFARFYCSFKKLHPLRFGGNSENYWSLPVRVVMEMPPFGPLHAHKNMAALSSPAMKVEKYLVTDCN